MLLFSGCNYCFFILFKGIVDISRLPNFIYSYSVPFMPEIEIVNDIKEL